MTQRRDVPQICTFDDLFRRYDLAQMKTAAFSAVEDTAAHAARQDNPHGVTKAQVGLGNADNTADTDKPLSTAALAEFSNYLAKTSIVDDLVTGGIDKALSAEQGKVIKALIDGLGIVSGSNANGNYVKYPDGTMICYGMKSYSAMGFYPTGNVFYNSLGAIAFPATFIDNPRISTSIELGNIGAMQVGAVTTTSFAGSVLSAEATQRAPIVRYIAIGRYM